MRSVTLAAGSLTKAQRCALNRQLHVYLALQLRMELPPRPVLRNLCPPLLYSQPKGLCTCKGFSAAAMAELVELL